MSQSIVLFNALKWLAACLLYIGIKALRAKPADLRHWPRTCRLASPAQRAKRAFTAGFCHQRFESKSDPVFLSLFTVVINPHTPLSIQAGYGVYLAVATGAWFCMVAMLFSHQRVRNGFARMRFHLRPEKCKLSRACRDNLQFGAFASADAKVAMLWKKGRECKFCIPAPFFY